MARILLVDGDDDRRGAVVQAIRKLTEHAVDEERDNQSALARVIDTHYDLVLLDARAPTPETGAFAMGRAVRANPGVARTPILFLTRGEEQVQTRLRALDIGASDVVVQPMRDEELVARIEVALRQTALSDAPAHYNAGRGIKATDEMTGAEHLADALRAERDNLRETFDVFQEALLLMGAAPPPIHVLVGNAAGHRLYTSAVTDELVGLAGDALAQGITCDRAFVNAGRSFVGRAYPVSGRRVLLYARDVTDDREREIRHLQAEKLASIGTLAAGVAHEINNPAAFVLGNIESLAAQVRLAGERLAAPHEPNERSDLAAILFEMTSILQESKEGMARIQRIARDLSSFARVDDGQELVDINVAVDSTLTLLKNELRHRATVEREFRATRLVRTSPARLGQIFLNLVKNAGQALSETEVPRNRITLRTYDRGPEVVFEVTDNGPGIPSEILPRIFESFFTTKPRGVGTGLGLSISQGIANSLGGDITVDTQAGRGATFRVRLPSEPAAAAASTIPNLPIPIYHRRRVLAVDDEALLLKAYRRMLADVHDISTALGGRDALLILEKERDFDVVLCDLQMPEMSGMELYAIVKSRYPELQERFIFVTGGAFSVEAKRFLEQEVTCLGKPFRIDELLTIIEHKITERTGAARDLLTSKQPGRR